MNGVLREFGPSIWVADGPAVNFYGFDYPTRMAAIRLAAGELFVWSPIALSDGLRAEIDRLGPVGFLVSPNRLHHLALGDWQAAYPAARMFASPGLRKRRKNLAFDAELGDAPDPAWAGELDQVVVRGSFFLTEVVFFHFASRTAIFADLIQNFSPNWFRGWRGIVARLDGITAPHPGAPRDWRATFLDRGAARAALGRILDWPTERVVIAHGEPAAANGGEFVRAAFAWLRR